MFGECAQRAGVRTKKNLKSHLFKKIGFFVFLIFSVLAGKVMPKRRSSILLLRQTTLHSHTFRFRSRIHFSRKGARAIHTQRKRESIKQAPPKSLDGEDEKRNIVPQAYWDELFDSAFVAIEASAQGSETVID